jgi:hypothetical protein
MKKSFYIYDQIKTGKNCKNKTIIKTKISTFNLNISHKREKDLNSFER